MDDGAGVDPVEVSPIDSPDHFQMAIEQQWRGGEPHGDDETEDAFDTLVDSKYHHGSPRLSPHPRRSFRKFKPLTLDPNLSPPFLCSPSYPSTVEGTPSPLSYTSDYFDFDGNSPPPPTKFDDNIRFHHSPNILIYDSDEPDGAHAWDLRPSFSVSWDAGDDSDASEPSDESSGYITFTGQSASLPPELGPGSRQFGLSESNVFTLDFPEDVGELLERDAVSADDLSVHMIGHDPGRPTPMQAAEILIELSVQAPEDPQSPPMYAPNFLLPRMWEPPEDSDEHGSFPHLRYPGSNVMDFPINVPLSPLVLMIDGFPDDASPQ